MKRWITIILLSFLSFSLIEARTQKEALQVFKRDYLPSLEEWFIRVDISDAGCLRLYSNEYFTTLNGIRQKNLMKEVISAWSSSLETNLVSKSSFIEVIEPTGQSLWRNDMETDTARLVDRYKFSEPMGAVASATSRGPWFVYSGFNLSFTGSGGSLSLLYTATVRVGSYLYKNLLDSAVYLNWDLSASTGQSDPSSTTIFGLISRFHFPVSRTVIPNIGVQLVTGAASSTNFVVGTGIRLQHGIFDISTTFGDSSSLSAGWNMFF